MAYVSVWIDHECDGACAGCRERDVALARIEEAERLLRAGEAVAALHALTDDSELPVKKPSEITAAYLKWREGKLPGFENYRQPCAQNGGADA